LPTDVANNAIGRMTENGVVSEIPVPTPDSGLSGITQSVDGSVWFTESNSGAQPGAISAMPDSPGCNPGTVWFAETAADEIGEISF
jgi:virginiamycin B lyase